MGQRHQVYAFTNQGAFAWHNQWCFGRLPLEHLCRLLRYEKATDQSITSSEKYRDVQKFITFILSTDLEEGVIHGYSDITSEVTLKDSELSFLLGDNNDGITIIDAREKPLKYCYLFYPYDEESTVRDHMMRPLSAEEYFDQYRSEYTPGPVQNYASKMPKVLKAINMINKQAQLLTLEQLAGLFPESMKGVMNEREMIKSTALDDLPLLINKKFKYHANHKLVSELLSATKQEAL